MGCFARRLIAPRDETELLWEGRARFHARQIDGKVFINDLGPLESLEQGSFYRAQITEALNHEIAARILAPEP